MDEGETANRNESMGERPELGRPSGIGAEHPGGTRAGQLLPSAPQAHRAGERSWVNTPMAHCLPSAEVYERLKSARDHAEQLAILHDQYADACLAYARRYARTCPCALVTPEDLVQDLFVKIAARQSLHRYEVRRSWLLCCLKNLSIDLSRKHRPRPLPFDPALEAEAVDAFDLALFEKQLHAHLAALRRELHSGGPHEQTDACKEAIFDDWVNGMLERPRSDEALRSSCGNITPGNIRVKRHRWVREWSDTLATWLRRDFGIERLQEWQAALHRSAAAKHDASLQAGRSGAKREASTK